MVYSAVRKVGGRRYGMKRRAPRRMIMARGPRGRLLRSINPTPTFVETYAAGQIQANAGGVFQVRVTDIPQVAQYNVLYKQYRINWVKVMLVQEYGYQSADPNAAAYNNTVAAPFIGSGRIAYAINDSPNTLVPANEAAVLTDNGCKVKSLGAKWSCSFRPVPDVAAVTVGGNTIATKQKFKQWFNFDFTNAGLNNPLHQGISYWITQVASAGNTGLYNLYYKVNFTLRDPQ